MNTAELPFKNLGSYDPANCSGPYNIPELSPALPILPEIKFWSFSEKKSTKSPNHSGIHFFLDDYRFNVVWTYPDRYIHILRNFAAVCAPDFSIYTNMPAALQIYNHYRKHWVGAYWQSLGINVVPTISWAGPESFQWCFDGEPHGSAVAISTIGTQKRRESKALFLAGYREMKKRLNPAQILCYGHIPAELKCEVVPMGCFYDKFEKGGGQ